MVEWITQLPDDAFDRIADRLAGACVHRDDGCINWTGKVDRHGYGTLAYKSAGRRREIGAHRAAFLVANGFILPGMTVHHTCYNILCINPEHLVELSVDANIKDAVLAGRPWGRPRKVA